jgi:hypothetical protein
VANTILTPSMITREALMVLENNLTFTKFVNRQYEDQFAKSGAKIGTTLNIRKPAQYTVSSGPNLAVQDFVETSVPLTVNQQKHVDITFSSNELTMSIQDFSERVLAPAVATLANQIDLDGLALYKQVYNSVGTPGTIPNSLTPYALAGALLDKTATPRDGNRSLVIGPDAQATIVPALAGLYNPTDEIGKQYKTGTMGQALGFKWSMDQNVGQQQVGPQGGTPLTNGVAQTGSTLVTDGWTAAAALRLRAGDVFTIAGVFGVNPLSKQTTGSLQQFVVLADASSDGAGNATLSISPAIVATGTAQNVTVAAPDNAAITVVGTANQFTSQSMAFHKNAFTLACVDLEDVSKYGSWGARVSDKQLGVSIRLVRQYAIGTDTIPCRLDILYGWAAIRPELACRIQS